MSDEAVIATHAGWSDRATVEELTVWWVASIAAPDPQLVRLSAVTGDDVVGYVDLHGDERSTRELGFVIGPSSRWGRGLGTMAASAGLEYGYDVLKLSYAWAEAFDTNVGSLRVLERIGMTRTGAGDDDKFLGGLPRTHASRCPDQTGNNARVNCPAFPTGPGSFLSVAMRWSSGSTCRPVPSRVNRGGYWQTLDARLISRYHGSGGGQDDERADPRTE